MRQEGEDVKPLIEEIRTLTVAEKTKTGAVALVNLIPYAGGAIAAVIGEFATHRKFEKVCDVLSDLNSRLEANKVDPEQHLSKDQIIEVVHETLQTAAVTSDKRKLDALKRGLGYAFVNQDSFERKQLFLQVLRSCTSLELALLPVIYESGDPYIIHEGRPPVEPTVTQYSTLLASTSVFSPPQGEWRATGNRNCDQPALLKFLADRISSDEGATEGAARLLDGKGLASSGPNLHRRDCKVLSWTPHSGGVYGLGAATVTLSLSSQPEVQASPLEASQTQFGRSFLRFCERD